MNLIRSFFKVFFLFFRVYVWRYSMTLHSSAEENSLPMKSLIVFRHLTQRDGHLLEQSPEQQGGATSHEREHEGYIGCLQDKQPDQCWKTHRQCA